MGALGFFLENVDFMFPLCSRQLVHGIKKTDLNRPGDDLSGALAKMERRNKKYFGNLVDVPLNPLNSTQVTAQMCR